MAVERCKKTLRNMATEDPGNDLRDALLSLSRNLSADMLGRETHTLINLSPSAYYYLRTAMEQIVNLRLH